MGYALIANLPPVYGIYSSFFPPLIYIFLGCAHHTSVGTYAIVSGLMTGDIVTQVSRDLNKDSVMPTNSSDVITHINDIQGIDIAIMISFIIGIYMLAIGIFQLGFISNYLSQELISGFITAAAILTLWSQVRYLLGINLSQFSGPLNFVHSVIEVFERITEVNFVTLGISIACITVLIVVKYYVDPLIRRRFNLNFPLPIDLVLVIIGTMLSSCLEIERKYKVKNIGTIPKGYEKYTNHSITILLIVFF